MTVAAPQIQPPDPPASRTAVWSLVLGILSIPCLWIVGSIPAIILGVMGIKKANADPTNVGGKGMALTGLITGGVGLIAGLIPASFFLHSKTKEKAIQAHEIINMRQTVTALITYADEHHDIFPAEHSDVMKEDYLGPESDSLVRTREPHGAEGRIFLYRPSLNADDSADEPVLLSPKVYPGGKRLVGFVDGHVEFLPPEKLARIVEKFE